MLLKVKGDKRNHKIKKSTYLLNTHLVVVIKNPRC